MSGASTTGIWIGRGLSPEESAAIAERVSAGASIFYTPNFQAVARSFSESARPASETPVSEDQIEKDSVRAIFELGDTEVNGVPLFRYFNVDELDGWVLMKPRLKIAMLTYLLEERNLAWMRTEFEGLLFFGVYFNEAPQGLSRGKSGGESQFGKFRKLIPYGIIFALRAVYGLFKRPGRARGKHMLLIKPGTFLALTEPLTGRRKYIEPFYYRILDLAKKEGFHFLSENPIPAGPALRKNRFLPPFFDFLRPEVFPVDALLLRGLCSKKIRRKIRLGLQKLLLSEEFLKAQTGHWLFSSGLIRNEVKNLGQYIWKYYSVRRYLARVGSTESITATSENDAQTKSLLDGFRSRGIGRVGLQHGSIYGVHVAYNFTRKEAEYAPFPELNAVYGKDWANNLRKQAHYQPHNCLVIGMPRSDQKAHMEGAAGPVTFQVLIASQIPQAFAFIRQEIEIVFAACKQIPDAEVIIRPHPRENDYGIYKEIGKSTGFSNFRIDPTTDLYQLILETSLTVTCHSTVGAESVLFRKPLLIVDPEGIDRVDYSRDGVALLATNVQETLEKLKMIKDGWKPEEEVLDRYIAGRAYKVDGRVAERFMKIIRHFP